MTLPVYSAAFVAFLLSVIICPIFIRYFRRRRYGQQVRKDGPRGHFYKAGTPTMGGIVFLLSLFITTFFFAPKTLLLLLTLFMIFSSAFLGFIDDYQKVVQRRSLGLRAREKLLGQFIFTLIFSFVLLLSGHSTVVDIPFTAIQVDFGVFYPLLIFVMVIGFSNAVNLTDGIDGLAGGRQFWRCLLFSSWPRCRGWRKSRMYAGRLSAPASVF